jgi:hypothetical protein
MTLPPTVPVLVKKFVTVKGDVIIVGSMNVTMAAPLCAVYRKLPDAGIATPNDKAATTAISTKRFMLPPVLLLKKAKRRPASIFRTAVKWPVDSRTCKTVVNK